MNKFCTFKKKPYICNTEMKQKVKPKNNTS